MQILDRIRNDIDIALRAIGVPRTALSSIGRTKAYKYMIADFQEGIRKQILEVVNDSLFESIHMKISKGDVIFTESDEIDIRETVQEHVEKHPISDFISDLVLTGYLIYAFEKGGQEFLNNQNLPKTFELTNENIKKVIAQRPSVLFKGMDDTTGTWLSDQIISGKKSDVSDSDITDSIVDKMSEYPEGRAEMIVRTESANMIGQAEQVTAVRNGASHKEWLTAEDDRVSEECYANQAAGVIGIDSTFPSGAFVPPQHPNCRCVVDYYFTPFQGSIWAGE